MADETGTDAAGVADPGRADPPSRRSFLQRAGVGAAGVAMGAAAATAITAAATTRAPSYLALPKRSTPGFDHIVVVMYENRSFDNMLGWLYSTAEKPSAADFDGLGQGDYSNPGPDGVEIPAHPYTGTTDQIMQHPQPDPGEHFPHVNTQLFDVVDPATNEYIRRYGQRSPYNRPPAGARATNSGFVHDFIINFRLSRHREPTRAEWEVAMGGFTPDMMPVLSTLAREFAVYDRWFAAVPSQTFCNRLFFHASTSHGYVTNQGGDSYYKWVTGPAAPTIFNRLEEAGISWRVYYDASQLISLTGMLHAPALQPYWKTNFRTVDQFAIDAATGQLPAYSFVEPRMIFNHQDMHPPWGETVEVTEWKPSGTAARPGDNAYHLSSAYSDVRAGDAHLLDVYNAIRTSRNANGSNALNTALVITFDEHGGTFDHVAPPAATPPDTSGPGEMGFAFDRLGVRVPAIVVSAYTASGTVIHDEMHHGSVINTISRQWGLRPLTARDADANPFFNAVNLTEPRQPSTWPVPQSLYQPPNPERLAHKAPRRFHARPLTSPARGTLGLLMSMSDEGKAQPENYGEAFDAILLHGTGLFGGLDANNGFGDYADRHRYDPEKDGEGLARDQYVGPDSTDDTALGTVEGGDGSGSQQDATAPSR